jgi:L-rhamnonate dehydratase
MPERQTTHRGIARRSLLAAAAAGLANAAPKGLRITSVRAAPLRFRPAGSAPGREPAVLPDGDPRRWRSFGPFSQLTAAILLQIRTDQGITGYGMGGGGAAACLIIDRHLRHLLLGANPLNIDTLWSQMFSSTSFYGRRGVVIQAIGGIDLALWDIAGRHAGKPVYALLGGPKHERIPAYYTGNDVERGLKLGFCGVKISSFADARSGPDGLRSNAARILEARRRMGAAPLLMADALCAWDVPYTLELARRVAEAKLHFIEEPLLPDDIDGYAELCRSVETTRIACGEHEATRYGFAELLRHRAAHILQPDVTWSGGLTECLRIAQAAEAGKIPLMPHRGGSVYGMSLMLAMRAASMAESFGTGESGNELMELLTPRLEKGHYLRPAGPGFGVEFTDSVLRRFAPELL